MTAPSKTAPLFKHKSVLWCDNTMVKTWFGLSTRMTCSDHDHGHAVQKQTLTKVLLCFFGKWGTNSCFSCWSLGFCPSIHPDLDPTWTCPCRSNHFNGGQWRPLSLEGKQMFRCLGNLLKRLMVSIFWGGQTQQKLNFVLCLAVL